MPPDRTHEIDPTAPVSEQASSWWILLNEGEPTAADRRAFAEWVTRSPERVEAFLQSARISQALTARQTPWPETSVEDLLRAAREARHEVSQLPRAAGANASVSPARRGWFGSRAPLAVGIAAVGFVL